MNVKSIFGAACAAIAIAVAMPAAAQDRGETVTPTFEHVIPNIPGKSLVVLVVDYAPGGASPSHLHAKSAFIFAYVLSGAIESQVNDEPKRVYLAGGGNMQPCQSHPSQAERDVCELKARILHPSSHPFKPKPTDRETERTGESSRYEHLRGTAPNAAGDA